MAVIQNSFTGNGSTTTYSFTFPYLKTADIKASIDASVTTAFTLPTATTLQFNSAPANGAKIKIYRETDADALTATFYAGSAIKSEDLNDNFTQNLYGVQEVSGRYMSNIGGTMTGDLTMAEDADIIFEGATDDAHETTLTVADPTADRTITLPNVTGTVVTTGDTGSIVTAMYADNSVTNAKVADGTIVTRHIGDSQVTTAKIASNAVTSTQIASSTIQGSNLVDNTITATQIAADAVTASELANNAVDTAAIADNAVTTAKLAADAITGARIADDSIDSEHYVDGSIDPAHLANNAVETAKIADTAVTEAKLASNSVTLAKMADNSVGTSELVDDAVTPAKIATNAVTADGLADNAVDTNALAADAVTDAKIADNAINSEHYTDGSIDRVHLAADVIDSTKLADNAVGTEHIQTSAVTTNEIADAELTTLAGMQSGTASILAGGTALAATLTEINTICDGKGVETTISNTDASYPTSGAVVDYVAAQIAPIGGLEVIANDASFPEVQPAAGVVISIADAGGLVVNGSGVSTTGRTVASTPATVTINGINSAYNSSTVTNGVGFLVSSTGSGQIYNFHKSVIRDQDILSISSDIDDFANRYRVGSSNPTSSNDAGDLFYNTTTNKLLTYNATSSAWEEAQSVGDFYISTLSSFSGTGGNSATFDGTAYKFTISNAPTNAQQLIVSINGVIQKPNAGTSQPSEGFALDGSAIIFSSAPASGSDYFITVQGSAVNVGTPSDNTVATAKIQNLAVTAAKIADSTITAAKMADDSSPTRTIQNSAVTTIKIADSAVTAAKLASTLNLADNQKIKFGDGDDVQIYHDGSNSILKESGTGDLRVQTQSFRLRNEDASEMMISADADGGVYLAYDGTTKLETKSGGIEVTGIIDNTDAQGNTRLGSAAGDSFSGTDAVNNTLIGKDAGTAITTGDGNVALGYQALDASTTANNNTAVGMHALGADTTGTENVAIGRSALNANTTANYNVAVGRRAMFNNTEGEQNVAVGWNALDANTTADYNTAVGTEALTTNTTGANNTAVGRYALGANTDASANTAVGAYALGTNTGGNNTGVGKEALKLNTTGINNTAVGSEALISNTTGGRNVAVGYKALEDNTTGGYNVAIGNETLEANTTASYNVAIGLEALTANTTGDRNVAIGKGAMEANTVGDRNTAVGVGALGTYNPGSNEDGYNTAVGYNAGAGQATNTDNTLIGAFAGNGVTGNANTAIGYGSLNNTASGTGTVAIGKGVLDACTDPDGNVGIGYYAASDVTTGEKNTIIGYTAGRLTTTGAQNAALGFNALYDNTTGDFNVALGAEAGYDITTGGNNVCIGHQAGKGQLTSASGELWIAHDNKNAGNDEVWIYGNNTGACYQGDNSSTWSTTSDQRLKKDIVDNTVGLSVVNSVKVRNFKYKQYSDGTPVSAADTVDLSTFPTGTTIKQILIGQGKTGTQVGVIAQELEAVCPDCITTSDKGVKNVNTDALFWHMLNAIKELSTKVTALEAK